MDEDEEDMVDFLLSFERLNEFTLNKHRSQDHPNMGHTFSFPDLLSTSERRQPLITFK